MRHEDPEKAAVLAQIAKRRNIYLILYIVFFILMGVGELISDYIAYGCAVLMGVFSGFAIICITNYKYIATDGRKQWSIWNAVLILFGLIIVPWIVSFVFSRITPIAAKIMGGQVK